MASKNSGSGSSSQSPRANRDSTEAPVIAKGGGSIGQSEPSKKDGINDAAWLIEQDRGGDGFRAA